MQAIDVRPVSDSDPLEFEVTVREDGSRTQHRVSMSRADYRRLTAERCLPAGCIEAAFRFLLEREPKESILRRFDVAVISRYFPDFVTQLPRYLQASGTAASR